MKEIHGKQFTTFLSSTRAFDEMKPKSRREQELMQKLKIKKASKLEPKPVTQSSDSSDSEAARSALPPATSADGEFELPKTETDFRRTF